VSLLEQHREYLPYYPQQQQDTVGQHSTAQDADVVSMETNDQQRRDAARRAQGSV